jgi:hypothetical protein
MGILVKTNYYLHFTWAYIESKKFTLLFEHPVKLYIYLPAHSLRVLQLNGLKWFAQHITLMYKRTNTHTQHYNNANSRWMMNGGDESLPLSGGRLKGRADVVAVGRHTQKISWGPRVSQLFGFLLGARRPPPRCGAWAAVAPIIRDGVHN